MIWVYHLHKKIILPAVMLLAGFTMTPCYGQQKVQFSQYMFNNLVINPAYAGAEEALSLTFIHRSQWSGVENAPTTQTLSAHTLFMNKHLGAGLTIVNDKIGVHKNLSTMSNFAYHLKVGQQSFLSMGLQAGFHTVRSDYASLSGGSFDPKVSNAPVSEMFFDVGAGFYFRSPRLHIGISAPELLPERLSFQDTLSVQLSRTNLFMFSKYRITLNEILEYEPSVLVKYFPDLPVSFDANINMIYRRVLVLGLSYRNQESIGFLLKAQITPQLELGYVYDHIIGDVSRLSNGSHELMVRYLFKFIETKVSSPR
jgi:type IX secretion system PorP/SprF family membrane protein